MFSPALHQNIVKVSTPTFVRATKAHEIHSHPNGRLSWLRPVSLTIKLPAVKSTGTDRLADGVGVGRKLMTEVFCKDH